MNRKGDVATLLLPIMALVFSLMALFAFLSFDNRFEKNSDNLNQIINEADFAKNYVYKVAEIIANESINCDSKLYPEICSLEVNERFKRISNYRDLNYFSAGNFFGKIRTNDFVFSSENGFYLLEVKGLFVQSFRGDNKIRKDFEIKLKFDLEGNLIN